MNPKRKKGNPRMQQLGRKKVETWLSEYQEQQLRKLLTTLGLPKAKFLRRAMNYFVAGGAEFSAVLKNHRYD